MGKRTIKTLCKCIIFGIIWAIILFAVAVILVKSKDYLLEDVLFIEGIIFIMLGVFSAIGGNSMGLSLQRLGQSNAQFNGSANLEVSRMEKTKGISKVTISVSFSTVSLILAGAICIISNFVI